MVFNVHNYLPYKSGLCVGLSLSEVAELALCLTVNLPTWELSPRVSQPVSCPPLYSVGRRKLRVGFWFSFIVSSAPEVSILAAEALKQAHFISIQAWASCGSVMLRSSSAVNPKNLPITWLNYLHTCWDSEPKISDLCIFVVSFAIFWFWL